MGHPVRHQRSRRGPESHLDLPRPELACLAGWQRPAQVVRGTSVRCLHTPKTRLRRHRPRILHGSRGEMRSPAQQNTHLLLTTFGELSRQGGHHQLIATGKRSALRGVTGLESLSYHNCDVPSTACCIRRRMRCAILGLRGGARTKSLYLRRAGPTRSALAMSVPLMSSPCAMMARHATLHKAGR